MTGLSFRGKESYEKGSGVDRNTQLLKTEKLTMTSINGKVISLFLLACVTVLQKGSHASKNKQTHTDIYTRNGKKRVIWSGYWVRLDDSFGTTP